MQVKKCRYCECPADGFFNVACPTTHYMQIYVCNEHGDKAKDFHAQREERLELLANDDDYLCSVVEAESGDQALAVLPHLLKRIRRLEGKE